MRHPCSPNLLSCIDQPTQPGRKHSAKRPSKRRHPQGQPEPRRVRQHRRQRPSKQALRQRPAIGPLDMLTRVIDEVHVMHPRWTRGHTRETCETAVEVLNGGRIGWPILFQHILGQIDSTTRRIQLISRQQIRRTSRRTKPAVNAGPQNAFTLRNLRISQLCQCEVRLHDLQTSAYMRPGLSTRAGSNCAFTRFASAASAADCG